MKKKTGKIIRINLNNNDVKIFDCQEYFDFLGGRGFGSWVIFNEVTKDVEPLSEKNKVVIATGCFTGTSLPGSSRVALVTKNALNNGICYSSGGGDFGPELKKAGFDAIIIEGKARSPVYLYINNETVEVRDATHLWGLSTWDTEDEIRKELDEPNAKLACIGPAGENLAKISCVMIDKAHALAWGGSGAILGYKKFKAIVVRGTKSVNIDNRQYFDNLTKRYSHILLSSPASSALRKGGTHGMAGVGGWSGKVPTSVRNLQEEYWDTEKSKKISEEAYKPYEKKRTWCYNCPLKCLHYYEMERDGEKLSCEGMHANSIRGLGSNWDLDDPFYVLKAHSLCNKYGLDVDGVSAAIAWTIECYEDNLINKKDTFGLDLKWGNGEELLKLIEKIALRQDFGDLLAEGVSYAAAKMGRRTQKYAMHVKNIGLNEQGLRSHKAWALGIATSTRGGGHLSGSPQTENRQIPEQVGKWIFNNGEAGIPSSYKGKGKIVAWYETYKAIVDSVGICYFNAGWYEVSLADINHFVELYKAFTGTNITDRQMWTIGERIVNLEKAFNTIHANFRREDDILPERIMESKLSTGPYSGECMDKEKFSYMLDEYYEVRGWDKKSGLQTCEILESLDMDYVIEYTGLNKVKI